MKKTAITLLSCAMIMIGISITLGGIACVKGSIMM